MKKLLLITTLINLTLLTSCVSIKVSELTKQDYKDIEQYKITWKDLFSQANSEYFVYIYSVSCSHCNDIKRDIINFVLNQTYPTYVIEYNKEIPISSYVEDSIGSTRFEYVSIIGTPSLLQIVEGVLSLNVAGSKEILQILSSYS